eukprot:TRINITY_DN65642_c7_g6_i1.p1 TRINITY_DN65642_c7_g6~~TRINITY_DN65642_c7_g6_i1.p1  ORF type:complete len:137 (-),score=25.45 TRINITY_DN65642_c7_g6_i1:270-680(-)
MRVFVLALLCAVLAFVYGKECMCTTYSYTDAQCTQSVGKPTQSSQEAGSCKAANTSSFSEWVSRDCRQYNVYMSSKSCSGKASFSLKADGKCNDLGIAGYKGWHITRCTGGAVPKQTPLMVAAGATLMLLATLIHN